MKKHTLNVFKVVFTLFLIGVVLSYIDVEDLAEVLRSVNPAYFLIMFGIWYVGIYVSSLRWNTILSFYGIHTSPLFLYSLYWIGSFFNNFLPSSFGGDGYKFVRLNKEFPESKSKIMSSIVLERIIGLMAGVPLSVLTGLFLTQTIDFSREMFLLLGVCVAIFAFLLVGLLAPFRLPSSRIGIIQKVLNGLSTLLSFNHPFKLSMSFGYSIVFLLLNITSLYFVFQAFDIEVSFLWILFVYPLIQLTGAFPFSINALGIREGASMYFFSLFGVAPEATLSVMITTRILLLVVSATGGVRYLFVKK